MISDAHLGLTAAIKRLFQGCSWQGCRVHVLRNLPSHVPKTGQNMVAAAMMAVFVIQAPDPVRAHRQRVTEMLRKQFPSARRRRAGIPALPPGALAQGVEQQPARTLEQGDIDAVFSAGVAPHERGRHLPQRRRQWPPAGFVDTRLVGSQLLEQQEEWQLERRRFISEATMAKIPDPEEPLDLMGGDQAEQAAAAIS